MSRAKKSNVEVLDTPNGDQLHDDQGGDQAGDIKAKPPSRELLQAVLCEIPTTAAASAGGDMFDNLDALRTSQDFAAAVGVKKVLTTIPVTRPGKEWFCRVHPSPGYRLTTAVLDSQDDKAVYIIAPSIRPELGLDSLLSQRMLVTAINRKGDLFLWPVKLSGTDGRENRWNRSAEDAVSLAMTKWVRMVSNSSLGCYEIFTAAGQVPDPVWPDLPFQEILRLAFRDTVIDNLAHPVLKRLRGEV